MTLEQQLACAERELKIRQRVYARFCEQGSMSQQQADHELACMAAICATLRRCIAREGVQPALFHEED